jgi:hypothetical protein
MKFFTNACIALLFTISTVQAQTFVYSTDQHVEVEVFVSSYGDYDIKFKTASPQEITYEWERISNTLPAEWTYSLCDYGACYPGVPADGIMSTISLAESQAGEQGFFKLTLSPENVSGEGLVQLYVYDGADYSKGDTVTYHITFTDTATATGIETLSSAPFSFYPNPATESITLTKGNDLGAYTLRIFDATGKLVLENPTHINAPVYYVDLSSLKGGIYLLALQSESGEMTSQRLVVQ